MNALEVRHLEKSYGPLKAVRDLSFTVRQGSLFAFLGVNGAGKSTTIHMLTGTLPPDGGCIRVLDQDVREHPRTIQEQIGVVFQDSVLDRELSVQENLECRAALYGMSRRQKKERIEKLCAQLNLDPIRKQNVRTLSGGQRRRVDIARALLHDPAILILDEPTTGLDPQTRRKIWELITSLRQKENLTVFLTTHYMEEAQEADDVLILDEGQIRASGTPLELKSRYTSNQLRFYTPAYAAECLRNENLRMERDRNCLKVQVDSPDQVRRLMKTWPELFDDFEMCKGSMDDVFLQVTGKEIRNG